jgi:iron complex transport system substrate-binding protein
MPKVVFASLLACCIAGGWPLSSAFAAVAAVDDAGRSIALDIPARRIVSLAPHATELIFAAGGGAYLVGVSEYSDYPPDAKRIASVGGIFTLDLERVLALKPDLVVAWGSGNSASQVAKLRALGIKVFESEPRDFAAVASTIERLARLTGTEAVGQAAADSFRTRLEQVKARYRQRPPVRAFYQIWGSPLMTVNGAHLISAALRLCGGENVFADLPQLAPTVSIESVLKENPEVIFASSANDEAFAGWRRFPRLLAVARGNLYSINADLMNRAGPRVLDGTESLCKQLDAARGKR